MQSKHDPYKGINALLSSSMHLPKIEKKQVSDLEISDVKRTFMGSRLSCIVKSEGKDQLEEVIPSSK